MRSHPNPWLLLPATLMLAACQAVPLEPFVRSTATSPPATTSSSPAAARPAPVPADAGSGSPEKTAPELRAELSAGVRQPAAPVSMIEPLIEKRDTLVATGYAVISAQKNSNPGQQRLMAIRASKLDAYRALTEQVYGQYLDSTTTVADMTVMSDTFRAKVEGVIYGAVLVSISPVGDDTYETSLSLDSAIVNDLRLLYLGQLASRQRARRAP